MNWWMVIALLTSAALVVVTMLYFRLRRRLRYSMMCLRARKSEPLSLEVFYGAPHIPLEGYPGDKIPEALKGNAKAKPAPPSKP